MSVVLHPHVYALEANKIAGVTENYFKFEVQTVVTFLQAEEVSRREICHRLVFMARACSDERMCLCGETSLKIAGWH
jgi:hypothetical protein